MLHPNPDAVFAPLFTGGSGFFLASDKVQVKYEMLRAHLVDGVPVTEAAAAHGYSRAAFYLVAAAFDQSGMAGLLDERRGRRGPVKLRPEIVDFIRAEARVGGPDRRAGGRPVRGAVAPAHHRAGARSVSARSFWPPVEAAQVDYETLRAHVLEPCGLPEGLAAARFARRGLAGLIAWPRAEPVFVAELLAAPVRPGHRTTIRGWRRWPPAISSCSTPPHAWIRLRDWHYRAEACGEGGAVCAGVHRAPGRPRHHRLAAGAAARTRRRRR